MKCEAHPLHNLSRHGAEAISVPLKLVSDARVALQKHWDANEVLVGFVLLFDP
jgi:hypothetical protein